jgi:hypothetical protein
MKFEIGNLYKLKIEPYYYVYSFAESGWVYDNKCFEVGETLLLLENVSDEIVINLKVNYFEGECPIEIFELYGASGVFDAVDDYEEDRMKSYYENLLESQFNNCSTQEEKLAVIRNNFFVCYSLRAKEKRLVWKEFLEPLQNPPEAL